MSPKYESDFTQRVIEAIENARLDAGVSVQDIINRSGIRRSSYFRKMRGETTFTTEDVDALARALEMDPFLLLTKAARPSNVSGMTEDEIPHIGAVDIETLRQSGVALAADERDGAEAEQEQSQEHP